MLAVADLPPIGTITKPWVGTKAGPAGKNPAATTCDRADFKAAGSRRSLSRTFLIPGAHMPDRFGLSETWGRFTSSRQAKAFVQQVRKRMDACEDKDLGAKISQRNEKGNGPSGSVWAMWRLESEISDKQKIGYWMGIARYGPHVAQVGFVPGDRSDVSPAAFRALVVRARDRLFELPLPERKPRPASSPSPTQRDSPGHLARSRVGSTCQTVGTIPDSVSGPRDGRYVRAMTTATAEELDERSPLRGCRDRFDVPEGVIYLNGNSLGALPRGVPGRLQDVIAREWGDGLIRSWNARPRDWIGLHRRVGDRIAPLVGAAAGDVHVGDSTSVSLFKTMVVALRLRPDRRVIVVEPSTFPTDGYVAQGVARLTGAELRWCDPADPLAAVDDDVALLSLTHVDFRTGAMYDLPGITAAAHERGALMQWDLCHSAGAVPVDLTGADADLAVGCTYKYLNGGPGSPAFTWVAPRLQADVDQPITGWMGHARTVRDGARLRAAARHRPDGLRHPLGAGALGARRRARRVRRREHGRAARHARSRSPTCSSRWCRAASATPFRS